MWPIYNSRKTRHLFFLVLFFLCHASADSRRAFSPICFATTRGGAPGHESNANIRAFHGKRCRFPAYYTFGASSLGFTSPLSLSMPQPSLCNSINLCSRYKRKLVTESSYIPRANVNLVSFPSAQSSVAASSSDRGSILIGSPPRTSLDALSSRTGFIRRVFGIVFLQLLLTASTSAFLATSSYARGILSLLTKWEGLPLVVVGFAGLGCLLWMQQIVIASRNQLSSVSSQKNVLIKKYALLSLFSLSQSLIVGIFTLNYPLRTLLVGSAHTIFALAAVILYSVIPSSLRVDLTVHTAALVAAATSLLVGVVANAFLGSPMLDQILLGCGAVLFVIYMAHDVQRIIGPDASSIDSSGRRTFKEFDAALAAANLYLSIIGFFIRVVKLLDRIERGGRANGGRT